jgi:hypothetical protein
MAVRRRSTLDDLAVAELRAVLEEFEEREARRRQFASKRRLASVDRARGRASDGEAA